MFSPSKPSAAANNTVNDNASENNDNATSGQNRLARLWIFIVNHPKSIATLIYEPTPFKLNALNIY